MIDGARDQGVSDQKFINAPAENAGAIKEKVGARIFGIFGFYSLPIRRAAFSAFIQAKGRLALRLLSLIRPGRPGARGQGAKCWPPVAPWVLDLGPGREELGRALGCWAGCGPWSGRFFFERKCCLLVTTSAMPTCAEKKQGAARIISFKTSQYFAFWPVCLYLGRISRPFAWIKSENAARRIGRE
jgi:hypothetical protein